MQSSKLYLFHKFKIIIILILQISYSIDNNVLPQILFEV